MLLGGYYLPVAFSYYFFSAGSASSTVKPLLSISLMVRWVFCSPSLMPSCTHPKNARVFHNITRTSTRRGVQRAVRGEKGGKKGVECCDFHHFFSLFSNKKKHPTKLRIVRAGWVENEASVSVGSGTNQLNQYSTTRSCARTGDLWQLLRGSNLAATLKGNEPIQRHRSTGVHVRSV